jgi:Trypsin
MISTRSISRTFALLLVIAPASCSGAPSSQESNEAAILFGKETNEFPAVVAIQGVGNCTGTFIGKRTLITAAHCIFDPKGTRGGTTFANSNGKSFKSAKAFHHGIWGDEAVSLVKTQGQRDFAILLFDQDVAPAVLPIDFTNPLTATQGTQSATIVGYGLFKKVSPVGIKHTAPAQIKGPVGGQAFTLESSSESSPSISHGDSGSPLLINGHIYGVASGSNEREGKGRVVTFANLFHPENIELLRRAVKEGAEVGDLPAPSEPVTKIRVAGRTYAGTTFCTDGALLSTCSASTMFGTDGTLTMLIQRTAGAKLSPWLGKYLQDGPSIKAGGANFDPQNSATYFEFTLRSNGERMYDNGGRESSLTK